MNLIQIPKDIKAVEFLQGHTVHLEFLQGHSVHLEFLQGHSVHFQC